jgi:5-methyltetrahydrofolate corrinoid/iron sulfur protein methyltransferase
LPEQQGAGHPYPGGHPEKALQLILIADNIRITNPVVEKALDAMDPRPIEEMAKRCEAAGAQAIDLNTGPLNRDPEKKMAFLVEAVQAVSSLPILIDTANPRAMEAGLQITGSKKIINGFSLEPAKLESILPLAKRFDVDIIGYLLYPNGHVPLDDGERLGIALELFSHLQRAGIEPRHLIIDPIIAPLMWKDGSDQNMKILTVIRTLPDLLGFDVRTVAGLSNLTTGKGDKDKKMLMEKAYLPMLLTSGLSMVLMDVFHGETVRLARACEALMSQKIFSWETIG